jgi:CheY-like chemotaxis protein
MADALVLVVDDEELLRESLAMTFEARGFKTLTARNGKEALEIATKQKVDLIVSDMRMPEGDGVWLLDKLRALHHSKPPVILATGFADITLEDAYAKGAEVILPKPFSINQLMAGVGHALCPPAERWRTPTGKALTRVVTEPRIALGRGGIFVAEKHALPEIGAVIGLRIETPRYGGLTIEGEGVVRWFRGNGNREIVAGFGVEFRCLEATCRMKVIEAIEALSTRAYIPRHAEP